MARISIYDSTLRDGAQVQGISYSVEDKLKIVERLDALGVSYVEAGKPGSNPKDLEFFARAANLKLAHAGIIAFGVTRKVGIRVEEDGCLQSLLKAGTPAIAIFGTCRCSAAPRMDLRKASPPVAASKIAARSSARSFIVIDQNRRWTAQLNFFRCA